MKYYTGIGSRETPEDIGSLMSQLAHKLEQQGWTLRSGGAQGADTFFEQGIINRDIYIPWKSFSNNSEHTVVTDQHIIEQAEEIASTIHPAWDRCSRGAKALHTRNIYQVLGSDLNNPSKFLVCWAPLQGDSIKGGTRTAWELAKKYNIPCFNLIIDEHRERIENFIKHT